MKVSQRPFLFHRNRVLVSPNPHPFLNISDLIYYACFFLKSSPFSISKITFSSCSFSFALSIAEKASIVPILPRAHRSEEHTSELQSRFDLVCRLLLEKKKIYILYH